MVADFFTKPLQGALFKKFRDIIMNVDGPGNKEPDADPQECVEEEDPEDRGTDKQQVQRTYAEVAKSSEGGKLSTSFLTTSSEPVLTCLRKHF